MKKYIYMSILSIFWSFLGCSAQNEGFKSVEADEFAKIIADTAVVRLDVRTAEEYEAGHIDDALNIDVLKEDFESQALSLLPQQKTIALYCRSGRRSKKAASLLAQKGYQIVELNSGWLGWQQAQSKK